MPSLVGSEMCIRDSSNIMSLTGIALAIGVIVDNGIIMSENSYRKLSEWQNNPENQTHEKSN